MTLDYNSLLLALGISGACLAATMVGSWTIARGERFLLTWGSAVGLIVAYVVSYSIYIETPTPLLGALSFAILLGGLSLLLSAACQFCGIGRPFRTGLIALGPTVTMSLPPMLAGFDGLGFIAFNVSAAAILIATARVYWLGRSEASVPIAALTGLYLVNALGFLLCAGVLMWNGQMILGGVPDNWAEDVSLGINIAGMTGIGALSLALNQWRAASRHRLDALTDPLTGLLNRRALQERIGKRPLRQFTAVIAFDLDGFKTINDLHGHAAGDDVIRAFAQELLAGGRRSEPAARLGGEEFALVVDGTTRERAVQIADRIRTAFAARRIGTGNGFVRCTVSAGVAVGKPEGEGFDAVLAKADLALYEAKRLGRNTVQAQNFRLVG
jgi:diguanylate cyclase (GGDEF)-like protein